VLVGILDYKSCSILPIYHSFKSQNAKVEIIDDPKNLKKLDVLVLPGVGATNKIMEYLTINNFIDEIRNYAEKKKKILGICAGMQIMAKKLSENNFCDGLDFFNSEVVPFDNNTSSKSTNIGWRNVNIQNSIKSYYFCHSYFMSFKNFKEDDVIGTIDLKIKIPVIVKKNNVLGIQFHPEKSQSNGRKLIYDFLNDKF